MPPPRPLRRLSAPVARAIPTLARKAARAHPGGAAAGTITRRARGSSLHGRGQVGDVVAVGVDGERPVGLDPDLGRAPDADLGQLHVAAVEHLGQRRR